MVKFRFRRSKNTISWHLTIEVEIVIEITITKTKGSKRKSIKSSYLKSKQIIKTGNKTKRHLITAVIIIIIKQEKETIILIRWILVRLIISSYQNIYSYYSEYIYISFFGTVLKFYHIIPDIIVYFWHIFFCFLLWYRFCCHFFMFTQLLFFPFFKPLFFLLDFLIYFLLFYYVIGLLCFCLSSIIKTFKFLQ